MENENPRKSAIPSEPVSGRKAESRSPFRKTMCRQGHGNGSRDRETVILSCPPRPNRHPRPQNPIIPKTRPSDAARAIKKGL